MIANTGSKLKLLPTRGYYIIHVLKWLDKALEIMVFSILAMFLRDDEIWRALKI